MNLTDKIQAIEKILPNGYNYEVHTWRFMSRVRYRLTISFLTEDPKGDLKLNQYVDDHEDAYNYALEYFTQLKRKQK